MNFFFRIFSDSSVKAKKCPSLDIAGNDIMSEGKEQKSVFRESVDLESGGKHCYMVC